MDDGLKIMGILFTLLIVVLCAAMYLDVTVYQACLDAIVFTGEPVAVCK